MASATLDLYYTSALHTVFNLASTSPSGARWLLSNREVSLPYELQIMRKLSPSSSLANDHIIVTLREVERNATTSKLCTASVSLDISIPKDTATISKDSVKYLLGYLISALNDATATAATNVNRTALIEGRDI